MKTPKCKKDNRQVAVRYAVAIPEKKLMELIRLDCARAIKRVRTEFFSRIKSMKLEGGKVIDFSNPDMRAVSQTVAEVLEMIQDAWKSALKEYADSTKFPSDSVPTGRKSAKLSKERPHLSNTEKGTIRALRKSGLSIKAIGKEIHRAEKVVRDYCKTLPF